MMAPLGVLSVGPAAPTTVVEEDVGGGPLGGHYQWVRQRLQPLLKKTLMVGSAAPITVAKEDINGGLPRGAAGGFGSAYHLCWRSHRWRHLTRYRDSDSIFLSKHVLILASDITYSSNSPSEVPILGS
jgi:hypothetical protein